MKETNSIRLKAAFLAIAFSLNTIVGFACAIGIDMGFNSHHHHDMEATEVHVHKDGKVHLHKKTSHSHKHETGKDDCCNDTVIKLSQKDKSVPQSNIVVSPLIVSPCIVAYYNIDISYPSQINASIKYFVRNYHPPIADIRIAIRSFQV